MNLPQRSPKETAAPKNGSLALVRELVSGLGASKGTLLISGAVAVLVGLLVIAMLPKLRGLGLSVFSFGGILFLAVMLIGLLQPQDLLARRKQRYGGIASVAVMAVIGIIALINLLSVSNEVLFDMTASQQYSLSPQALSVLAERLDGEVIATAFFVDESSQQQPVESVMVARMKDYLEEFARQSDGLFSYRVFDPERFPDVATKMGVDQWPVVVFEEISSGNQQTVLTTANPEQEFLTALLEITGLEQKAIYILDGYSSWNPDDLSADAREGFGFAVQGILSDSYAVRTLNLLQVGQIPDDAAAVVAVAPNREIRGDDVALLEAYLQGGGRLLVLFEPNPPPTWRDFIVRWGIQVLDGYVVDLASHVAGAPLTPVVGQGQYRDPHVTSLMDLSFFPGLAPLWPADQPEEGSATVDLRLLAVSSETSFATDDLERAVSLASDAPGPFIVGAVARARDPIEASTSSVPSETPGVVAVFGDSDFISNKYFYAFSNGDLFLNVIGDMVSDETLVSVRPKPVVFREMAMTPKEFAFVRYTSWLLLPVLISIAGTVVWWRRR